MMLARRRSLLGLAILWTSQISGFAAEPDPLDWANWRGPEQNRISREKGLVDRWNPRGGPGSNLLWKSERLAGRSTPIVLCGRLYTIVRDQPATVNEGEKVVCVDAATGRPIWEHRSNVYLSDVPDTRLGWSCVAGDPETGRVYFQGVCGYFACLEGDSGKVVWSRSLHEQLGLLSTYGGRTNVPLVFEDLVITSSVVIGWGDMRVPAHRFMAFDKASGEMVWFAGTRLNPYDTNYSTPTISVLGGQVAMVLGSGDGSLWALQPRTGQPIWHFRFSRRGLNVSPLVAGDRIYSGHSEENIDGTRMGAVVALDGRGQGDLNGGDLTGKEIWKQEEFMVGKSSPVLLGNRLYAIDDRAKLFVFDPATGEQLSRMRLGTVQRSTPLVADGKIYTCTSGGRWYTLRPDGDRLQTIHTMRLGEASDGSPIVSHGRLYVPTSANLYCIGRQTVLPTADTIPTPPRETPADGGDAIAHLQIVPCEALLKPGEEQTFSVRLYNDRGQQLHREQVTKHFSVKGPGEISDEGRFNAPSDIGHVAAEVECKIGNVSGRARIRIIPPLSWKFDFEQGFVPITWVGMRNRHVVANLEVLDSLASKNQAARKLYLFLVAQFTNAHYRGRESETLDLRKGAPRGPWASLLQFMEKSSSLQTSQAAKAYFDPLLEALRAERVVKSWQWQTNGIGLSIKRTDRGLEGQAVMVKLEKIPVPHRITKLGTRSRGWCGSPDMAGYTIRADFVGLEENGKMPDLGLVNQRYTMALYGASQELRLYSWCTHERRTQRVNNFSWKPGLWYTMKLTTRLEEGKAHVRGKVWPRGTQEPDLWTIDIVDTAPNRQGSPGFFGNAKDTEFYVDNVVVTQGSEK